MDDGDLIPASVLFAEDDHGWCCDCCEGYCPMPENDPTKLVWQWPLVTATIQGVDYVGSRFVIVRADVVEGFPEENVSRVTDNDRFDTWAVIPAGLHYLTGRSHSASTTDRLDRAGLASRDYGTDVSHLFLDERHVGWTKFSTDAGAAIAIAPDDLPLLRKLADVVGLDLNRAARALNLVRGATDA